MLSPADLAKLKQELKLPAYVGLSDEAAAKVLGELTTQVDRETIDGALIAANIVRSEHGGLNAKDLSYLQTITGAGTLPLTPTLKAELAALFPAAGTTATNLKAAVKRRGHRAEELGLSSVPTTSDVADARRLP